MSAGEPCPSDAEPAVAAFGDGDVAAAVVSMSRRHPDGLDADYLEWHVLDHLPEQYRLPGLRLGQRWVSTPACREARAVSEPPFDEVDHVVQYLFAEPVGPALDAFFPLGGALRSIGRMPMLLPRVMVGGWELVGRRAAPRVLVGASVIPWRPATGIYAIVERIAGADPVARLDDLVAVPGVAGAWCWTGADPRHDRLDTTAGLGLTVCHLDGDPVAVAGPIGDMVARGGDGGPSEPLLAAPFELVRPGEWDRSLP